MYATRRPRIIALDILRGYFLLVIIVDHLNFFPSIFELFTGRGQLWASAAEGFFIISGLLAGYMYGPRMVANAVDATKKIWRRAALLYALTVVLTFLFVWWGNMSDIAHIKEGLWAQPPLGELLFKTLTLQYYYGWADFLPYYAIVMIYAPVALYACTKGRGWMVLAVSVICWLLRGNSFEMSWQLLFMGAIVAGWYLPALEKTAVRLRPRVARWLTVGLYALACATLALSALSIHIADFMVHTYPHFGVLPHGVQTVLLWLDNLRIFMTPLIVKWTLEPVRALTAIIWFTALYVFVRQREASINRLTRNWLKTLGEHSLVVYVMHAITVFGALLIAVSFDGVAGIVSNSIRTIIIIALIYTATIAWQRIKRYSWGKIRGALRPSPSARLLE